MNFDREAFMSLVEGDKELFASLLSLFEADWPMLIRKIRESIKEGQVKPLEESAHRLKGNLKNFYATPAAKLAQQLEDVGKAGNVDQIKSLGPVVDELLVLVQAVQDDLQQFLKEM